MPGAWYSDDDDLRCYDGKLSPCVLVMEGKVKSF